MQGVIVTVFAFLALSLTGCGEPPRTPNRDATTKKTVVNVNTAVVPSHMQPDKVLKKTHDFSAYGLADPLTAGDEGQKKDFVAHLYATADNYRWNKLDDKMQHIGISNLDGPFASFNGLYHPHPNRPFLWVKQEGNIEAGLLKEGDNHVIRYYKMRRGDNVDKNVRCWWIGTWTIDTKKQKPNFANVKQLTWHCQIYNTFSQLPERGWAGEVGNKIFVTNAGADRLVVDK